MIAKGNAMSSLSIDDVKAAVGSFFEGLDITPPENSDSDLRVSGLTSLNVVKLVIKIEKELGVAIPDQDFTPGNFKSIKSIYDLMERLSGENA